MLRPAFSMNALLDQQPEEVLDEIHNFRDHAAFCRECLTIRNKAGEPVPLELWPAQQKLSALIRERRRAGKPVRIVNLKPRRVAMSVAVSAEFFHEVPFRDGQHATVVAHQVDAAAEIFNYYQQFQESFKPFKRWIGLPQLIEASAGRMKWENGSNVRIATANNLKTGRGFSNRYLQLDEYAFYRDARTLMTALMSTVPNDPDTMVIVPSTANGVGGPFHELWLEATDPARSSDWVGLFFAWWEHHEYTRPIEMPRDVFQKALGRSERYGDELAERAKYNLTLEQLNWRRWTIDNTFQGSGDLFRQEYPGCPEEAFLTSGRPKFSHEALGRMAIVRNPIRGDLETVTVGTRHKVTFLPHEQGELAIYRKPEAHRQYVIGADAASGKDINDGKGSEDRDWCVATALDRSTGEQVAKFRKRIEPGPFGEFLSALGEYFNYAYLVPEANTWGIGVLEELLRQEYPVSLIYERQRTPDDRRSVSVHKIGFETTNITRPQLISALDTAIREYSVLIRDANTLQECLTFVVDARGRPEGQQGCHDDEVFALALAVIGLRTAPKIDAASQLRGQTKTPAVMRYGSRRLGRYGSRENDRPGDFRPG